MNRETWRPNETAPKDGSSIDLWGAERERYANVRITDCFWFEGKWMHGRTIHDDENPLDLAEVYNVTHWMPRPAPPEE